MKPLLIITCPYPYLAEVTERVAAAAKPAGCVPLVIPSGCEFAINEMEEAATPRVAMGFNKGNFATGPAQQLEAPPEEGL